MKFDAGGGNNLHRDDNKYIIGKPKPCHTHTFQNVLINAEFTLDFTVGYLVSTHECTYLPMSVLTYPTFEICRILF